jgi:deoxyribodipyrimidine photolyase-related protein
LRRLRFVLGDQLSLNLSSLRDYVAGQDVVLMCEVAAETTYVKHHQQKLVLILSAMRHFSDELRKKDYTVDYIRLNEPHNSGSFTGELQRAVQRHQIKHVVMTEPGEWRVADMMARWPEELGISLEVRDDDRFLCSRAEFARWAGPRNSLRMEYFYREMRRKTGWLMNGTEPIQGQWNFDSENRKSLPKKALVPPPLSFSCDRITQEVMSLVRERFATHFGELETFNWAVTRAEALRALAAFITDGLPHFGEYQDAMHSDSDFVYHSLLSPYLNIGLLEAREVCEAALVAWHAGAAPLNAVEGFIRQIAGWREYVRGLYWLKMPDYARSNYLQHERRLPDFYWDGNTDLACLKHSIRNTRQHAYAHHIQRLMILGNFALLAGVAPHEVEEWYLLVYADAFEWVELPNTHGMALYADGGLLASKPYISSGAYINRMSNYCGQCRYNVKLKSGADACPFNYLYWNFLLIHRDRLDKNPRLSLPYRNLAKFSAAEQQRIRSEAQEFLQSIGI